MSKESKEVKTVVKHLYDAYDSVDDAYNILRSLKSQPIGIKREVLHIRNWLGDLYAELNEEVR